MKRYDEKTILAFAIYSRDVDLVKATGLSRSTIQRYKKDKNLVELASGRRDELLQSAVHRLECELLKTVTVLCQIRDNSGVNPQTRVSACNTILNHYQSMKLNLEIYDRLEALEKRTETETD